MTAVRRGWFHLASGAVVGRALAFSSNLLLSRWLGPIDLGLFNLVTTTVQTSDTLVRFGGDYALNFELGGQPNVMKTQRGVELARGFAQLCSLSTALICIGVAVWVGLGHGLFPNSLVAHHRLTLTGLLLLMIACEGVSASAWEVLLVNNQTSSLALRQGLFYPLRLLFGAVAAFYGGVFGAMVGWSLIAVVQCIWLKTVLKSLWTPLQICPPLVTRIHQLLKRGLPFYAANLLASMIFYPLLLKVAAGSGLSEIGYLRVGQILQQLFAFLPATLVPVLFLKLRGEPTFNDQVSVTERPLRVIWFLLLEVLLIYCMIDHRLIVLMFGDGFMSALLPTRLLLLTSLFECLAQLAVQPLLAAGKTRLYGFWQNIAALSSAVLGWLWIPKAGLAAFLIVRLLYVIFPLLAYGTPIVQKLNEPRKLFPLALATLGLLLLITAQIMTGILFDWLPYLFASVFITIGICQRQDILIARRLLRGKQ